MTEIVYNPLYRNLPKNKLIEKYKKRLISNDLSNWICPICYKDLNYKKMYVNFPFKCNHLTCFSCFKNQCDFYSKNKKSPHLNMKCCLCRSLPNYEWINSHNISGNVITFNGFNLKIYDTNVKIC